MAQALFSTAGTNNGCGDIPRVPAVAFSANNCLIRCCIVMLQDLPAAVQYVYEMNSMQDGKRLWSTVYICSVHDVPIG